MEKIVELLISLSDLDNMLKDLENENYPDALLKKMDFEKVKKSLIEAREEIIQQIPKGILNKYEKFVAKYGRGIAPVINGVCMNCFSKLPTSMLSKVNKNKTIDRCPNCGIFIYYV